LDPNIDILSHASLVEILVKMIRQEQNWKKSNSRNTFFADAEKNDK